MTLATFFSSFMPTAQCEAAPEKEENEQSASGENDGEESKEEEEEEEEEPEDVMPAIREDCANSGKCASLTKHFNHCQEKVEAGEGFKGEDCVEEMCSMMHCVDACSAPKLFAKLR
ncbi:Non-heme 11 kDa protein of cytochrome bc1 complex [Schizopora paradoxa]|uniref:Non-heme 11 kDa protein of cytochrome bc1 complex n=1 Tax=Schizopora paradoxa TaxID=27342 RepID=A0A0H2S4P7_9AGAM|nr:Non-heme 11 kDa protein of cytochrome bc1 complex [Schizopora paradoxa]